MTKEKKALEIILRNQATIMDALADSTTVSSYHRIALIHDLDSTRKFIREEFPGN